MKLKADLSILDIIVHLLIWFVLSLITFGIALMFFPYSFSKFVIDRTEFVDAQGQSHTMECQTQIFGNLGHVILWLLIVLITFGFGYFFYFYRVWNYSLNNTVVK